MILVVYHPDDEYLEFGVAFEIEKDRYGHWRRSNSTRRGCHIRWSNGRVSVEPIQFIEKVHADVVE